MRLFLHLLIFAVIFSGYSAAAHASAPVSGDQGQVQVDTGGCPDCEDGAVADQDNGASKACGSNCHCCCMGHVGLPSSAAIHSSLFSDTPPSFYTESIISDFTFSLLRPPRNLV